MKFEQRQLIDDYVEQINRIRVKELAQFYEMTGRYKR
jgi:hypothetical protein